MELCRIYLARRMRLSDIGRQLGEVGAAALSHNGKRLASKLEEDSRLRKRFEEVSRLLERRISQ
jgi:hypothetical protein